MARSGAAQCWLREAASESEFVVLLQVASGDSSVCSGRSVASQKQRTVSATRESFNHATCTVPRIRLDCRSSTSQFNEKEARAIAVTSFVDSSRVVESRPFIRPDRSRLPEFERSKDHRSSRFSRDA